jgi:hypothetical protein
MSFVTQDEFNDIVSWPIALPHTQVQAGETVIVATRQLNAGDKLDLSWLGLHLINLTPTTRSSELVYSSQSFNIVTASDDFFNVQDVGGTIVWSSSQQDTITSYNSPTSVSVTTSRTITPAYFNVVGSAPIMINSSLGPVYVGLYTAHFFRVNQPSGNPIFYLTSTFPGATILAPRAKRIIYGPDVVSVAVSNNTTNINMVEVSVSGLAKVYV